MIIEQKELLLWGQVVFSWVKMKTPMEGDLPLPAEACFAYILEGDQQALLGDSIRAEKGQVILSLCGRTVGHLLPQQATETGYLHSIIAHFQKETLLQVFDQQKPPFWQELEQPLTSRIVQTQASALIKAYFENISTFFEHPTAVSEPLLVLKIRELILLLLQNPASSQIHLIMRSLFSDRVFSFKEVIEANLYENTPLDQLAALTNSSLSTFKRTFKTIYQTTPAAYFLDRKLEKAKDLLTLSDKSISDICFDCGFSSPAYLSRVFKAKYQLSPSQFRLNPKVK